MQVRFTCPACKQSHVLDMPETTIHMTCSRTSKHLELRLGLGGEVKSKIVCVDGEEAEGKTLS
ncbi:MAG: hypothetical protein O7B26_07860 [Planctomycetota bacterium]|nr:hypothetical protein [Planctomycetota bacterium]